jgi:hypothetical protein
MHRLSPLMSLKNITLLCPSILLLFFGMVLALLDQIKNQEGGMEHKDLYKRLAYLEFVNDQLTSEVAYVDQLLRDVGFAGGINSVKEVAHELIKEGEIEAQ